MRRMDHRAKVALCMFLTRAELARRHARTRLGFAWSLLLPLISVLATWIALDLILRLNRSVDPAYGLALAVGLAPWLFVSEAVNASLASITSQPHLVKKTVFPVGLLPISTVLASAAAHVFVVCVLLAVFMAAGHRPSATILSLPLWIAAATLFAVSVGAIVAALNVVLPDSGAVVPALVSIWFWLTPIVWPLALLGEGWRALTLLNPLTSIVEGYRYAFLGSAYADPALIVATLVGVAVAAASSVAFFTRARPLLADAL